MKCHQKSCDGTGTKSTKLQEKRALEVLNMYCVKCDRNFHNAYNYERHIKKCEEKKRDSRSEAVSKLWQDLEWKKKVLTSLKGKRTGRASTEEKEIDRRKRISESIKKNPNCGGIREGSGRGVKTWYESPIAGKVYLRSTYELIYVKYLDRNEIEWKQNSQGFDYFFDKRWRKYYPDFIVGETYIEVKGFKTIKDEAKWQQFPHLLKILYWEDLKNMVAIV